jgi:hypothetical protein
VVNLPLRAVYSEGLFALNFSSDANTLFPVMLICAPDLGRDPTGPIRSTPIPFTLHPARSHILAREICCRILLPAHRNGDRIAHPMPGTSAHTACGKKAERHVHSGSIFPSYTKVHSSRGLSRPSRLRLRRDVDICNKSELRVSIRRGTTLTDPEHRSPCFNVLCQLAPACTGFSKVGCSLVFSCLRCQNPH